MRIIKPTGNVIAVTTQNTVSNSKIVFIATTATALINTYSNSSTQIGSFVLPANQTIFLEKVSTDLISANTSISVSPVTYKG